MEEHQYLVDLHLSLSHIKVLLKITSFSNLTLTQLKNKPENPVGQLQLIVESERIRHVPPFWQILAKLGGQVNEVGGGTVDISQKGPNSKIII